MAVKERPVSDEPIWYDENEYRAWQNGGPPPVPRRGAPPKGAAGASREAPREAPQRYAPPHETGVVEAEQVAHGAVLLVRLVALLLWAASLVGTYVPLAGGWEPVLESPWPPALIPACIAGLLQFVFTWAQWSFKSRAVLWWRAQDRFGHIAAQASVGWWLAYIVALLLSSSFSIATYGQWIAPVFAGLGPPMLGWIVVGIAAILADMLPEWIMVRS